MEVHAIVMGVVAVIALVAVVIIGNHRIRRD
jgi:hypothetical protein